MDIENVLIAVIIVFMILFGIIGIGVIKTAKGINKLNKRIEVIRVNVK